MLPNERRHWLEQLVKAEHDLWDKVTHSELFKLNRLRRLFHPTSRKHTLAVLLGVAIILGGAAISTYREHLPLPHLFSDALGYFIHGVGCFPIVRHLEPLWLLICE